MEAEKPLRNMGSSALETVQYYCMLYISHSGRNRHGNYELCVNGFGRF